MYKKLFVIIVTWNGMKWIHECLNSLRKSNVSVQTVVIDNGSKDETVSYIRQNFPEVHLIESGKNLGFGQANNEGMRYALSHGCDYVYLLNQDAYVYPDMFEKLLKISEKAENKQYAILSPLHVHGDRVTLDSQFRGYMKEAAPLMVQDMLLANMKEVYPVEAVPAAGWFLSRHTLETIGGFDPIFFHYGEDHHYAQRVRYHNYLTGIVPTAKMVHDRETFGNVDMAKKDMYFRSLKTEIYLNITLSKADCVRKLSNILLVFTFESVKHFFMFNFKHVYELQKAFWGNLFMIPKYALNRKANKQIGKLWL